MTKKLVPALLLAGACTLPACRQTVFLDQSDGSSAGGDGSGGGETTTPFCGGGTIQQLTATPRWPDVILAVDHSAEMQTPFGTGTRLSAAQENVLRLASKYQTVVRFGYLEFPAPAASCGGGGGCCAETPFDPVLFASLAIQSAMGGCNAAGSPCNSTQRPIADALVQSRSSFAMVFDQNAPNRYVLLITGGDPNCSLPGSTNGPCSDARSAASGLNRDRVKTEVFGIADDATPSSCLDMLALAGGANGPTSPYYHLATTPLDLGDALSSLMSDIAEDACHIDVRTVPQDPNRVALFLNNQKVPVDDANGWDYDNNTSFSSITVHGSYCQMLTNGSPVDLNLLYCNRR